MRNPLLFAHRGDTVNFSENTIDAFRSAFDKGADGIELDVQISTNGELIVVHDFMYNANQQYPLLEDVIEKFKDRGRLEIELKSLTPKIIEKVETLITKYNPSDFELTSSVLPLLPLVRKSFPDAKIGIIFRSNLLEKWMSQDMKLQFLNGYMNLTGANIMHLELENYTPEIANNLHKNGYLLHTLLKKEDNEKYKFLQELGIDQCTFDDINLLKSV